MSLKIEELCVERGGRPVLHDVSLAVPTGEVTALLGPNGAGKSTLVLAVAGSLRPTSGRVLLDDDDLTRRRPERIRRAGVAVVPEGRRLLPDLSVADNLRVATYSLEPEQAERGTEYALELFPELKQRWRVVARALSGGEQQMVVLAQALVSQPAVVLVDELSLGLAPIVVKRLVPIIASVASSGVGVLLIEQFAHVALGLAQGAHILQGGRIRYSGTARELQEDPELLHSVYLLRACRSTMELLAGRVAVVTGGASGIGLAMAQRLAAEGMRIVLADIERPVLARAGDELARSGVDVLTVPVDVSLAADVEALAATTLEHFGDVHLVCNNAGVGSRGLPIAELPLEDFSWVLGVNLFGVIHGIRSFLPHMLRNGAGHIINTASISGLYHLPRMGPYNASKAAVIALSETLRFELEGSGVGVSVLCPSWVRTNISTSDRNRPERFAYALDGEQMARAAEYKAKRREQLATLALDPESISDHVVDAVRTDRFYVITHPESAAVFGERARRIVAGDNPIEPPQ